MMVLMPKQGLAAAAAAAAAAAVPLKKVKDTKWLEQGTTRRRRQRPPRSSSCTPKCNKFTLLLLLVISWLAYNNIQLLLVRGGPERMDYEEELLLWAPAKELYDDARATQNATSRGGHSVVVPQKLRIYWLTDSSLQDHHQQRMETAFQTLKIRQQKTLSSSSSSFFRTAAASTAKTIQEAGIVTRIPWWTPQQVMDIYHPPSSPGNTNTTTNATTTATKNQQQQIQIQLILTNNVTLKAKEKRPRPPNEYSYQDAACLLTHLTALMKAYDDHDHDHEDHSVLVVTDAAILTQEFFTHWQDAALLAPADWTVLQWTTSNLAALEQGSHLKEPWISWLPDLWGTHAYLIHRNGLEAIRNSLYKEERVFLNEPQETRFISYTVDDRFDKILYADELLFSVPGQRAYTSTFPWIVTDEIRDAIPKTGRPPFAIAPPELPLPNLQVVSELPTRNETLLVFMNIRVASSKRLSMEMDRVLMDIHSVCWIHRYTKCDWIIRGTFTHDYLYQRFQQKYEPHLPIHVRLFETVISTARFNKFGLITDHVTKMSQYDLVLIKDNDQRLTGFPWASFLEKKGNALVGGPLRQAPEESFTRTGLWDLSQHYKFHDARGWKKNAFAPWVKPLFINADPIEVPFLEMYFNVFDGQFAEWFFSQVLTQNFTQQDSCWGPDFLWCPAAQEYAASITTLNSSYFSNVTRHAGDRPTGCVLVPFVSVHEDTRQIEKDGEAFNLRGYAAVEMLRASNPAFERWYNIALKYARGVIAWRQLEAIAQHCRTKLMRGAYKAQEHIDFAKCRDAGLARKTIV